MLSLDDDGDFGWECRYCHVPLNQRSIVDVVRVETWNLFSGQDISRATREWTFCSHGCRLAWYGP